MSKEVNTEGGIKRIDIVYTNSAREGFFLKLLDRVDCRYVIVEVKNIDHDPENPEFEQLNGRFKDGRGHFGILVCRKIKNYKEVITKARSYLPNNFIIVLSEDNIIELLEYTRGDMKDEIEDLMDKKLRDIIF